MRGIDRAGPTCRASRGGRRARRREPFSTHWPPYMTTTVSQVSATTPRSCVMMMTAELNSSLQLLDQLEDLRLHRHVERGRRLVGDQQLRVADQRHRDHRALAHTAGELVRVVVVAARRRSGCRPAPASRRALLARACLGDLVVHPVRLGDLVARPCRTGAAPTADPGRSSPSRSPRSARMSSSAGGTSSWPSSQISPETCGVACPCAGRGCAWLVTDLPEPDSPTMPRISPRSSSNDSPSTLLTMPSSVGKCTRRSSTTRKRRRARRSRGARRWRWWLTRFSSRSVSDSVTRGSIKA